MKLCTRFAMVSAVLLAMVSLAGAQSWTTLTHPAPAPVGPMLQLRDGRILFHEDQGGNARNWWVLTPDATGSYVNGTWSSAGSMPSNYSPFFFSSQVMMDGHTVVIEGGEYNFGSADWTNLGAVLTYNGNVFTWASNTPPSGWTSIGDAQTVILPNSKLLQSNCCTKQTAIYGGPNTWTPSGNVLAIRNDEAGYNLLWNDKVLMVDLQRNANCFGGSLKSSELYDYTTGTWSCAAELPTQLWQQADQELGAAIQMFNGKVFQLGGSVSASAVYDVASNTWAAGPTPPNGLDQADGPAALEPNGLVLAQLSPGLFQSGCQFMEYNPDTNTLANAPNPPGVCPADSSFVGHLFVLPTGQIAYTDFDTTVYVYTPAPGIVGSAKPLILSSSTHLHAASINNVIFGRNLNGLSEAVGYGDDYQGSVNFPLVKLTNISTGQVYWTLTHDDSTHSIKPNTPMSTLFNVPPNVPNGAYNLTLVAAGIESNSIRVNVP